MQIGKIEISSYENKKALVLMDFLNLFYLERLQEAGSAGTSYINVPWLTSKDSLLITIDWWSVQQYFFLTAEFSSCSRYLRTKSQFRSGLF